MKPIIKKQIFPSIDLFFKNVDMNRISVYSGNYFISKFDFYYDFSIYDLVVINSFAPKLKRIVEFKGKESFNRLKKRLSPLEWRMFQEVYLKLKLKDPITVISFNRSNKGINVKVLVLFPGKVTLKESNLSHDSPLKYKTYDLESKNCHPEMLFSLELLKDFYNNYNKSF